MLLFLKKAKTKQTKTAATYNSPCLHHRWRVAVPDINEVGRYEPCSGKRPPCQLCSNMKNTSSFKSKHSNEVYQINKNFNCNSKMLVSLIGFVESHTVVVP